ncbi:NeuD/PglB/VioB family sugar acetyltransferase [Frigoribacterium sp. 2-23]|uniref:NeuD/PglB/VioB family sugar acetyltransferase n=1 Tax=Frigoribacterium sp. 2-23 TaxID=3415006 RepID=UPI003C6FDE21
MTASHTRPVVVVGAGGFGREALDVLEAAGRHVLGVVDDGPSELDVERVERRGYRLLGPVAWLADRRDVDHVIGIGSPAVKRHLDDALRDMGSRPTTVVHPEATIGSEVALGPGTIVCAGARLSTNVSTGRHVHVLANAAIGHDTSLCAHTSVNPAATVSGSVSVAAGVLVGAASVVLQGLTLGAESVVGAGACVVRDVPPARVVKGVPAV